MIRSDSQLQHDVMAELAWEPRIDHADIGVAVNDGIVTLSGYVKSYPEKIGAEKATLRVAGVTAIAEEIEVRLTSDPKTADHEIARRILDILTWDVIVPERKIGLKVEHGWVTLSGSVDWYYESYEACKLAGKITGVAGIINLIHVGQGPASHDIKERITAAFERQAGLDARAVTVSIDGGNVQLTGKVKAWNERHLAERVVWSAPGVTKVEDNLIVAM